MSKKSTSAAVYQGFKYPIHELKEDESAILKWPDIAEFTSVFSDSHGMPEGLDTEFLMRYIILMYTPGSPAITQHRDVGRRKTWVLAELGVKPPYPKYISETVLMKNASVRKKVVTYLRMQHSVDWSIALQAEQELAYVLEMASVISEKTDEAEIKTVAARTKLIDELRQQIADAQQRITEHERDKLIQETVHEFRAQENMGIRIEEIAMLGIPALKPHEQTADRIFPEVGN